MTASQWGEPQQWKTNANNGIPSELRSDGVLHGQSTVFGPVTDERITSGTWTTEDARTRLFPPTNRNR